MRTSRICKWLADTGGLGSWRHNRADGTSGESKLPHWEKIRGIGPAGIAKRPPSTIRRPGATLARPARPSSPMLREPPKPPAGAECHLSDGGHRHGGVFGLLHAKPVLPGASTPTPRGTR